MNLTRYENIAQATFLAWI